MMRLLVIAFLLGAASMQGQEHVEALALKYPFLDTAKNHMEYYGSEQALEGFFNKLDQAIFDFEGKVNVVHIGGSHVQGGMLGHTLRMHLGQLAPELNVERGFFFHTDWQTPTCQETYTLGKRANGRGVETVFLKKQLSVGLFRD